MNICLSTLFLSLLLILPAHAQEGVQTRIHHTYTSPRALGMGDAFIATANDYSALFYNPAGLARRDSGQINMSVDLGLSSNWLDFKKDADEVAKQDLTTDQQKFDAYATLLQKYYGKAFLIRAGLLHGIWVRPNWGFGILPADLTVEYQVHNQAAPALDIRAYLDTTVAYGYGNNIKGWIPGEVSWGTTFKFVNRGYANREVNALTLSQNASAIGKKDFRDGYTVDADIGFLYSPPVPSEGLFSVFQLAKPTFGAVVRNVVDSGFKNSFHLINKPADTVSSPLEPPEKLHRVVDLGAKFEYPSLWLFGGRGEVDFRDIGHPNYSLRKSFHLGFEFDWTVTSWWKGQYRFGINQGYPTAGLSALLFIFNLDAVIYSEDVGTFSTPKENRVYMVKLNLDL
jgi:hypothetical protein